ncbi:phosphoribosylglycinamide formyltransferase [Baekduia soli]|uniref:Phosphoribosylglycinamide formyltransferase n=1 Tax=Baekduia soli TaxID=496014 RepID=A0A5B8U216_9ACTN|nr:phosphoribosylglycinamide formyltransferase [Baekduia soli]QEC47008.1 phosphoribosylglycinamide formyltransferase [Baekduia soli]
MAAPLRVGVLASGAGTNLQALLDDPEVGPLVVAVASDRAVAGALERARRAGVPTAVFAREEHADRAARDAAMADWLHAQDVGLVVLAGYMALLEAPFIARFRDRIVNVHPSLLPAFPGIAAVQQAIDYGVKVFGVTVHLVDEGVDTGAILLQRAIELPPGADAAAALRALRPLEHTLLPQAVRLLAAGRVRRDPGHPRRLLVDA